MPGHSEHPSKDPRSSVCTSQVSVFRTTRWNVIRQARAGGEGVARGGAERLARTYWYPLYAFARRHGLKDEDAKDVTQGFLSKLLTGDGLRSVEPAKGRFRSFLLASFKNYLADQHERAQAVKRGGGVEFVPLDTTASEERYQVECVTLDGDEHYDRDWAQSLMAEVLERLSSEWSQGGKARKFQALQPFLIEDPSAEELAQLKDSLSLGDSGMRSALQRLRFRFGEYLWTEVARTVGATTDVDEETRYLLGILSKIDFGRSLT